jgi:hypothetical protein
VTLARVKTWIAGELLTANDLNGEFNNILSNPISLVSPTTGTINFALQSHTGLVPTAITATSGSTGQALVVSSSGAPIWANVGAAGVTTGTLTSGALLVYTSALVPLAIGTTGQVLAVTSSNSSPAWQVIPTDGGLSTTVPSTGMIYFISTGGPLVGLAAGANGTVLTMSTVPTWQLPSGSGGGTMVVTSSMTLGMWDDFLSIVSTTLLEHAITGGGGLTAPAFMGYNASSSTVILADQGLSAGVARAPQIGTVWARPGSGAQDPAALRDPDWHFIFAGASTATAARARIGVLGSTQVGGVTGFESTTTLPADAIFIVITGSSAASPQVTQIFSRQAGTEFQMASTLTLLTSAGARESAHFRVQFSSSGSQASIYTNGVLAGTFTSSQVPTSTRGLLPAFGTSAAASAPFMDAWSVTWRRPDNLA